MAGKLQISLFSLFSLLFLGQSANLSLLPSDRHSLSLIQSQLSLTTTQPPCSSTGITCRRHNTTVIRITKIVFEYGGLSGTLSPAIGLLSELKELSLAGNLISGEVPPEISSLVKLRVLDLSSNRFSGNLNFLEGLWNLETVALSGNLFSGKVPGSLRSLRNLKVLDLSGNSFLEGPIPVLRPVEYSDEDKVPRRYVFAENHMVKNQSSSIAAAPSASLGSGSAPAPAPAATKTNEHKKHEKSAWRIALGLIVGGVAGTLSGLLFSALFKLVKLLIWGMEKEPSTAIFSPLIKKAEDLSFLENEAVVSSLEVIGKGGCGEVYKAELPGSNGKMLAVKKIVQPSREAAELSEEETKSLNKFMRQIRSEIQTVGHIRHRNLVPLLAHVPRPDCHFLVYEYMKNGSLHDLLYQVCMGTRELDWLTRHNIAVGVASGLEYLHMSHNPRIIHRDLKPGNILLGDDMEAKITDFGLAKAMPNMDTHVSTSKVAGTVGYIAPEYHQTLKFTDKCDVYSFGVVLGVLVIGKFPSDEFFQHTSEMSLVKWMRNVMTSEDPTVAIDRKLIGNGYEEQMLLVLKIACFCTQEDPRQRPNSKDIRCMLSQIVH